MTRAWVGLGANLGDPPETLSAALQALDDMPRGRVTAVSPAYWTAAWGKTDQPDFLNAVACLETGLAATRFLDRLLAIESRLGRQRGTEAWGPRVIDLDLLVFGDQIIEQAGLKVPHRYLAQRAFVLVPLNDLAPELVVPGLGRVDELLAALDDKQLDSVRPASPLPFTQSLHSRQS